MNQEGLAPRTRWKIRPKYEKLTRMALFLIDLFGIKLGSVQGSRAHRYRWNFLMKSPRH